MACRQLMNHQSLHLCMSLLGLSAQQAWATVPERQLMERRDSMSQLTISR